MLTCFNIDQTKVATAVDETMSNVIVDSAVESHPTPGDNHGRAAMVVFLGRVLEWFPVAFSSAVSEPYVGFPQCPEVSVDLPLTFQRFFRNIR